MDWVERFYSLKTEWLGEPGAILDYEWARARIVDRLCGEAPKRVLELGAGSGGAAAATADQGYAVTAVELSAVRAANARRLAAQARRGALTIVEGDFYAVDLGTAFDVVAYWDGFGVGTDDDQRRLLKRIADDWLAPGGTALIEVFAPWAWARDAGTDRHAEVQRVRGRLDFHPLECRFTETVWREDQESQAITQTIRCYSPADFGLLLAGTGLRIDRIESLTYDDADPVRLDVPTDTAKQRLIADRSYLVRLVQT